jgi:hypothetical protein
MERNLYAPPAAPVADPMEPVQDRPPEVTWAVRLYWASLAAGFFVELSQSLPQLSLGFLIFFIATRGVRYLISVWILLQIATGRNWARLIFVVVLALGLGYTAYNWQIYAVGFGGRYPVHATASIAKVVLDIGVACLLFMPRANRWFKPVRAAVASSGSATAPRPSA